VGVFAALGSGSGNPSPPHRLTLGNRWILEAGHGLLNPPDDLVSEGNGRRGFRIEEIDTCLGLYTCPSWVVPLDGTIATHPVLSDDQLTVYVGTADGRLLAYGLP